MLTEDLVVGHNQEVVEEEVLASQEIVLGSDGQPEELGLTADGQLVVPPSRELSEPGSEPGHLVIHGGEIFVNNGETLSQLHLIQAISGDEQAFIKSDHLDTLTDFRDGLIDHTRMFANSSFDFGPSTNLASINISCDLDSSSDLTDIKQEPSSSFHYEDSFVEPPSGAARTLPLTYLIKRDAKIEKRKHSALIQRVMNTAHPK